MLQKAGLCYTLDDYKDYIFRYKVVIWEEEVSILRQCSMYRSSIFSYMNILRIYSVPRFCVFQFSASSFQPLILSSFIFYSPGSERNCRGRSKFGASWIRIAWNHKVYNYTKHKMHTLTKWSTMPWSRYNISLQRQTLKLMHKQK